MKYPSKTQIKEIYELIAGENAIERFTPEELIEYIKLLNEQISDWENETHESFLPEVKK